jgi:ATP-dependent RNA helicase DDX27
MCLVFNALGMRAAELHGDMTQAMRYEALASFTNGDVQFLMASDVAALGLDITGVEDVVNYNMPGEMNQYVHRVGRTARKGRAGRAVSLIGEANRELMKEVIKQSQKPVQKRTIPEAAIETAESMIDSVAAKVAEQMQTERETYPIEKTDQAIAGAREVATAPIQPREQRLYTSKVKPIRRDVTRVAARISKLRQRPS